MNEFQEKILQELVFYFYKKNKEFYRKTPIKIFKKVFKKDFLDNFDKILNEFIKLKLEEIEIAKKNILAISNISTEISKNFCSDFINLKTQSYK